MAAVLALGYSLYMELSAKSNPTTAGIDHHARLSMTVNSDALNALVGKSMPDIQLSDKDGKVYTPPTSGKEYDFIL